MAEVDEDTEIVYIIDGSGPDGKFQKNDDLKEEVLETLSTYLHCLSKDGRDGNKFQISPTFQKISTRSPNGDPAPLDDNLNGSTNPFAPTSQNSQLSSYSDSGKIFAPTIGSFLTKGKADTFLKDLGDGYTDTSGRTNASPAEGPVFDAVREALDNNRFSPGANGAFINDGAAPTVMGRIQPDFGRYTKGGQDITIEDLSKVGFSLMFRAAREIKAVQEGDPLVPPESFQVGLGALIPGASQIALLKADTNNLRASTVMEENFGITKPRTDTEPQINKNTKSWGHLNTPLEPYSGFLPVGMTLLSVAMALAVRLLASAFVGFLSLMIKEKLAEVPNRGPFMAGEYGKAEPPGALFSLNAIGIRPTERDFLTVVNQGLDIFFAFDGSSFKRAIREPQFFAIFTRNIIRSGNIIVNSVAEVFSGGQNPLAAAQAFLGLIDVLKSSKIIAFLNILAQIGDRAAEIEEQGFEPQERKKSSLENLPINPATNVMRIRNGRSSLASGMRNSATLSKFVFPTEILRAGSLLAFDSKTNINKAIAHMPNEQVAKSKDVDGNGRIKKEVVAEIENALDSEYMPFYFHDLRTNEIISFHAFLKNLEDAYTPQYESATAYGRVDNVRTYVSTERNLNLSFNIVATSKEDFDVMWWKINKLSSLLYPSWTEGRAVAAGDTKFIQPFSQLPASTPLMRLRIGDVIRSNYSKFSLSRLFGIGTDKSNILQTDPESDLILEKQKEAILKERDRMLRNPAVTGNDKDGYQSGERAVLLPKRAGYPQAKDANPLKGAARAKALFGQESAKKLTITTSQRVEIIGPSEFIPTQILKGLPGAANIKDYGEHRVAFYKVKLEGEVPDELSGEFLVTHDDLLPETNAVLSAANVSDASLIKPGGLVSDQSILDPDLSGIIVNEPLSGETNAIVRSFESTQGKGLAGVITGLTFTEMAAPTVTWETSEFGSRAPKLINVTMTYAVIHDIAPGLDSSGFMRAVQYPVGNVARNINGDTYEADNSAEADFNKNHLDASKALRNQNSKNGSIKNPL